MPSHCSHMCEAWPGSSSSHSSQNRSAEVVAFDAAESSSLLLLVVYRNGTLSASCSIPAALRRSSLAVEHSMHLKQPSSPFISPIHSKQEMCKQCKIFPFLGRNLLHSTQLRRRLSLSSERCGRAVASWFVTLIRMHMHAGSSPEWVTVRTGPLASLLTLSFFVLSRQRLKMRVLGVDVET